MTPDDPRHGTVWGYNRAGCRCDVCGLAHHRRCKQYQLRRHQMGGSTTVDAAASAKILTATAERMSLSAIGRYLGTSHSWVSKVIRGDIKRIAFERAAAIRRLSTYRPTDRSRVITLGARRRLQALHAIGYTWPAISHATGYSLSAIKSLIHGQWDVMEAGNAATIADAYDRLSMTFPVGSTRHEKGAITSARIRSAQYGWLPPLAWNDIDDPNEQPTDWQYVPAARAEILADLCDLGVGISEACRRLKLSRNYLQKWCGTNGLSDLYRALAARESTTTNQYTDHEEDEVA